MLLDQEQSLDSRLTKRQVLARHVTSPYKYHEIHTVEFRHSVAAETLNRSVRLDNEFGIC